MDTRKLPVMIRRQVATAPLPENYKAACLAIRECAEIDQVSEYNNRAAALATYARQAQDLTLITYAQKIQVRAETRVGELLLEMYPCKSKKETSLATGLKLSRVTTAQTLAGIPADRLESIMDQRAHTQETLKSIGGTWAGITASSVAATWENRPDGPRAQAWKEKREREARERDERTPEEINAYAFSAGKEAVEDCANQLAADYALHRFGDEFTWSQAILGATDKKRCSELKGWLEAITERATALLETVRKRELVLEKLRRTGT